MHPLLSFYAGLDQMTFLQRRAERHRFGRAASVRPPQSVRAAIQLRVSACREELERLAALSERPARDGDWLVAELDGVPVAAVSVDDGSTIYDPFKATSQMVSLLELRRKQVLATAN
jgi:hypothetical protein